MGKTSTARLAVCDTGTGVPPELLPKLTQRFVRAGDHVAGTGLGLAISREIVELHGGTITFESPVPGTTCGTAVYVEIPLAQPPRIMSYVPEKAAQTFLATHIQKLGYDVAFFEKPTTLCEACLRQPPSLLLLDGRSTTFDIREFLMQLRENQKTKRLPIIIFGEATLSRSDLEFYRQHAIFYFTLPWTASDLAKTLSLASRGKLR